MLQAHHRSSAPRILSVSIKTWKIGFIAVASVVRKHQTFNNKPEASGGGRHNPSAVFYMFQLPIRQLKIIAIYCLSVLCHSSAMSLFGIVWLEVQMLASVSWDIFHFAWRCFCINHERIWVALRKLVVFLQENWGGYQPDLNFSYFWTVLSTAQPFLDGYE